MAEAKPLPSAEELHALLRYDPATGAFHWRERGRERFSSTKGWSVFNKMYAGKRAGGLSGDGRLLIGLPDGGNFMAHRIAWTMYYGTAPSNQIDHIDGNPLNNRIDNLRDVSVAENQRNRGISSANTSGVTGVCWFPPAKCWHARVKRNGKYVWIAYFKTLEEAAVAVRAKRRELGFTERHGT